MQSEPRSGGQNLDSLLIMPIQRIPRYILLIEVLLSIPPLFLLFPFYLFLEKDVPEIHGSNVWRLRGTASHINSGERSRWSRK